MKPSRIPANRRARHARLNPPISLTVDLGAFNEMISKMERDVSAALRPATQAGAEVIYQAVLRNVDKLGSKTGNLRSAVYQAFSPKDSVEADGGYKKVRYDVSWNHLKAPHALLVEYGHIQRYAVHLGDDGKFYTVVRPSMRGKPKPKRGASQAEKDAYYVLRAGGPQQIAAQPFMRPVFYKQGEAAMAVEKKFWEVLGK